MRKNSDKDDKITVSGYVILFNDKYPPDCISTDTLDQLIISGEIEDYTIDKKGVKVTKSVNHLDL